MRAFRAVQMIVLSLIVILGSTSLGGVTVFAQDEISRLVLNKNDLKMDVDSTQSLTATAIYVSGKTEDVTVKTDWTSNTPAVADVYAGVVSAKSEGTAVLTATYMGKTVVVNVKVNKKVKALTSTKQSLDLHAGSSAQVELTAVYQDGSSEIVTKKADWESDTNSVMVVNGLITGVSSGTATITASYGSKTVVIPVSVDVAKRIDVDTTQVSLLVKGTTKVKVTATYPDGKEEDVTEKAEWSTDKANVADALKGTITGYGVGKATITAKYGTKTVTIQVDVDRTLKLDLSEQNIFMKRNDTKELKLTATYPDGTTSDITDRATWSSNNDNIASVYKGKIIASSTGEAIITATYGEKTVSATINVETPRRLEADKELLSLKSGQTAKINLSSIYTNNTQETVTDQAEWSIDNETIADVTKGNVTAKKAGQATITAKYGGKSMTMKVEVDIPNVITPDKKAVSLPIGGVQSITLTSSYPDGHTEDITSKAEWSTASSAIAEVRNGVITGVSTGATTITAKYGTRTAIIQVSVGVMDSLTASKTQLLMKQGSSENVVVTAKYADGSTKDVTKEATWTSSNPKAATVDAGSITAVASGETTITASLNSKTVKITVQVDLASSLTTNVPFVILSLGETKQITLTATDSLGTKKDVTKEAEWSVSNVRNAQVVDGLVTAIGNGSIKVTAKYGGKTISIPVEINVISKLEANTRSISTKTGQTTQIKLTATLSDGSTRDVTTSADWTAGSYNVVDVANGLVSAKGSGKTSVTAKLNGRSISIPVDVDTLKYLKTDVVKVTLKTGATKNVKAIATYYSDGLDANVTKPALWTSSNIMIADVKDGVIKAIGKGTATITVSYAGKTTKVSVTVE